MEEGAVWKEEEEEETAGVAVAGVESSGATDDLHGDLLEAVISRLSLFELLPASCVSRSWRRAVALSLDTPSRLKPWLIVRPSRPPPASRPSAAISLAYDPGSDSWMRLPSLLSAVIAPSSSSSSPPLRCSQGMGNLLYALSPSRLSLSWDPLNLAWRHVGPPQVWRTDPLVALVGTHYVVVAGGACDFEDDPLAVEVYRLDDHPPAYRRLPCEPMPLAFKNSASRAWLSVAASDDHRMFVLAKHSGTFASLDLDTMTWAPLSTLNPGPSTFFSVIGFSDGRLIQVGLDGDAANLQALRIWELLLPLDPESGTNSYCERNLLGEMPRGMLERLTYSDEVSSIEALVSGDFAYIYDPSAARDFFFCDFSSSGAADDGKCGCSWGCFQNPVLAQGINPIDKFVFSSSKVTIHDLRPLWNHEISTSLPVPHSTS
ncbi:hypothetical protein H6P81_009819 [Aristolochia fimbriata]|uniref:F-box domain-containing protein n=1 Tax=Aristolochia fimbriata TaxID=158543 RepID=A0AAV7EMJ5_ARIFI|nr:hypothetical protein H6P81_009819 [Aristolochia fimbriata]